MASCTRLYNFKVSKFIFWPPGVAKVKYALEPKILDISIQLKIIESYRFSSSKPLYLKENGSKYIQQKFGEHTSNIKWVNDKFNC